MINLNDPFYGTIAGLLILIAFGLYLVFFTDLEEPKKQRRTSK